MNWDAVQAVAESIGALAVVVSIAYVALQIRQNTRSIRASAHQDLLNHVAQLNLRITDDPTLATLILKARVSPLDPASVGGIRLRAMNATLLRHYAHAYSQFREGILSEDQWRVFEASLRRNLRRPNTRLDWEFFAEEFSPEFQSFVTQRLREVAAQSEPPPNKALNADVE